MLRVSLRLCKRLHAARPSGRSCRFWQTRVWCSEAETRSSDMHATFRALWGPDEGIEFRAKPVRRDSRPRACPPCAPRLAFGLGVGRVSRIAPSGWEGNEMIFDRRPYYLAGLIIGLGVA